jgi:hypothetical protein
VVPIGKLAQKRNVVVCHLPVRYASECQVCGLRRTRRVRQRLAFASYLLQLVKRASQWIEQKRT